MRMKDAARHGTPRGTVLVVDDEHIVLKMLHSVLGSRGHRVITTDQGTEAKRVLDAGQVDVLVADLCMPELDGAELLAWARLAHPEVRRIAFSGANDMTLAKRCVNDGKVDRYLTKPCTAAELIEAIEDSLRSRQIHTGRDRNRYEISLQRLDTLRRVLSGTGLEKLCDLAPHGSPSAEATTVESPRGDGEER